MSNGGLLPDHAVAHEIANHDHACGNSNTDLQAHANLSLQRPDGINQRQARPGRLDCALLFGLRVAEIGKHAVPHVADDVSVVTAHDIRDAGIVGDEHAPEVFGVETSRERRGANEITEHDCQLASLGVVERHGVSHGQLGRACPPHSRNGAQNLQAMLRRDPEILQVLLGEMMHVRDADGVLGEPLGVLGEADRS